MKKYAAMVLLLCTLLPWLAACRKEEETEKIPTELPAVTEITEPTTEETIQPIPETTAPAGPVLLERPTAGKVCVGFLPTEAGNWRYVEIEDQEAAVAAYEKAANPRSPHRLPSGPLSGRP